jgi:hypothetical protein
MRKYILLVTLLIAGSNLAAQTPQERVKHKIIQNLKQIEESYFKYLSFEERRDALQLMNETILLVQSSRFDVSSSSGNDPNVLGEEGFQTLLKEVSSTISESEKTTRIRAIGKRGWISCSQLRALLNTYTFDNSKVELIKSVYNQVYDPVNISLATSTVQNSILRKELEEYLANL